MKKYEPKDFSHLIGMEGFSKKLLENHFKLYQGYVENTNKLQDHLKTLLQQNSLETPEFAEIKRRFGWEFDGMRLHEFYFGNLGGESSAAKHQADFFKQLKPHWDTFEKWETDFRATGEIRGIGWAILYRDPITGFFFNAWINEHEMGHFAGCTPILVMDLWEHAFMLDYGTKKDAYIDAFMKNINWEVVKQRLTSEQPVPVLEKEFATSRRN